jgi:hypothetical protein
MRRHYALRPAVPAILAVLASLAAAQAPPNDNCSQAWTLYPPHVISGSTVGATWEGHGGCAMIGADVWFVFTAPFTGTATASTCPLFAGGGSANFDTVITIRQWSFNQCSQTVIACCSDDAFGCGLSSHCVAPITIGQSYLVQVGGYTGLAGNYTLSLYCTPQIPANDACANAVPVIPNSYYVGENFGATTGPDPTGSCVNVQKDLWYSFSAPTNGLYTADTCYPTAFSFDTAIAVWQGTCGALTQVACDDNGCPGGQGRSSATWCASAGTTYLISVGGANGSHGQFNFIVNPSVNPPMKLAFFNSGPGSLGFSITNGPLGGTEFTAMTFTQGAYPNAWFFGIDPSVPEVLDEWATGYPFTAPLSALCGSVMVGPFLGLPAGLTVYAVSLGFAPAAGGHPSKFSNPASGTVP